jgi:uncharacterized protein with PIN domain
MVIDTSALIAILLAKYSGEPLLFKGDDFCRTDVPPTQSPAAAKDRR